MPLKPEDKDALPTPVDDIVIRNPRPGGGGEGLITARAALGGSQNVPAFRAAAEAGLDKVIEMAKRLGITTLQQNFDPTFRSHESVDYGPSIATGGANVRPIDMAVMNATIANLGVMPLPPYIAARRAEDDRDRRDYQTVYAKSDGSVAAPTAGLHFTPELLDALRSRGVSTHFVTLHVGAGTFKPVELEDPAAHVMHEEVYAVPGPTADAVADVKQHGGHVWAVGTTSVRTLETAADESGTVRAGEGETRLFIRPPYRFRVVDRMLTNFHLPRSTLLMLVAAFGGTARVVCPSTLARDVLEEIQTARSRYVPTLPFEPLGLGRPLKMKMDLATDAGPGLPLMRRA